MKMASNQFLAEGKTIPAFVEEYRYRSSSETLLPNPAAVQNRAQL